MCTSLLIKSKIDNIFYGAPLDSGNDPYIRAIDIIKLAKHKINIFGGLLEDECKELIYSKREFDFVNHAKN
jgi:tRNA(Arg) A34 adenosine deaminase TadA